MAELLAFPIFQAVTPATGLPLAGGLLYSYAPNSSTPKATFSDIDGAVPNTNPVVLDANGRAVVYLSGKTKLILKDSTGTQQWSRDYVEGISSDLWWTTETGAISYVSANSFTVTGADATTTYVPKRALKLTQGGTDNLAHVVSSSFDAGTGKTTIVADIAVSNTLSAVQYGQPVGNEPKLLLNPTGGLTNPSNGLAVLIDENHALSCGASGLYVYVESKGGLKISSAGGLALKPTVLGGLATSAGGAYVHILKTGGLASASTGMSVKLDPHGGLSTSSLGASYIPLLQNQIIKANADYTPVAFTVPTDSCLGRSSGGSIVGMTGSQIYRLIAPYLTSPIPTGAVSAYAGTTSPTGWLLLQGGTFGNSSSGGSVRANADCQALFTLMWSSFTAATSPMLTSSGGSITRGATAAADWAAQRRLTLLDARGKALIGTGTGSGLTARVHGEFVGEEKHALTGDEVGPHTHPIPCTTTSGMVNPWLYYQISGGTRDNTLITDSGGTGNGHNTMQPSLALNYIIKL